jgi:Tfp pilus assembly protein PilV
MKKPASRSNRPHANAGFSILEPLLAASLIAFLVLGIVSALVYGRATIANNAARSKALFLAEEALEAVRSIRSDDFSALEAGAHGLSREGGVWSLSEGGDSVDGFQRTIEISDVDASSKQITASVEWATQYGRSTVSIESRLFNWQQI